MATANPYAPAAAPAKLGDEFVKYFTLGCDRFRLGFHGDFYLMSFINHLLAQADAFVETGAAAAVSVTQVARGFPNLPCYSCEPLDTRYAVAAQRVRLYPNIHLAHLPSPDFLHRLAEREPGLRRDRTVFWLDAHGNDVACPLADEVRFLTANFDQAAIMIDDFEVPGRGQFAFDEYPDGTKLCWDYIAPGIARDRKYTIVQPNYAVKTSLHAPLVGWILIASGEWNVAPAELESYYDARAFDPAEP